MSMRSRRGSRTSCCQDTWYELGMLCMRFLVGRLSVVEIEFFRLELASAITVYHDKPRLSTECRTTRPWALLHTQGVSREGCRERHECGWTTEAAIGYPSDDFYTHGKNSVLHKSMEVSATRLDCRSITRVKSELTKGNALEN